MYQKIKRRTYEIIEAAKPGDILSKVFDIFIMALIFINVIAVVMDTFDLPRSVAKILKVVEVISVIIFTAEYLLRLWTCEYKYPNRSSAKSLLKYVFSFMAIIDLLAIMPFYLPMIISVDLRVLRMLRIFRLMRIFKINRYTKALTLIGQVFKNKSGQLISSIAVVLVLILIASVIMYNVEHEAQPERFTNVFQSMWWAIATLTTVGYGDIYPVTIIGKMLSATIALLGIGLVAVPTGIITAGFSELVEKEKKGSDKKCYCPYCGHKID